MGTCRLPSLQRLQCRKAQRVVFCYSKQAVEKQRLGAVMEHQQKQRPGEALLLLKVADGMGPVSALLRNLSDSRTSEKLFFSASLPCEHSLLPLLLHAASPEQDSLLGQEPHSQGKSVSLFMLSLKPSVSSGKISLETY